MLFLYFFYYDCERRKCYNFTEKDVDACGCECVKVNEGLNVFVQVVWIHSSLLLGYGREILLVAFKSKNIHACLLSSQENFRLSVMEKTAWFYLKFLTLWTVKGFNIRSSCLSFSLPSQMLFIAVTVTTDSRSMLELCTFSPPIIPI